VDSLKELSQLQARKRDLLVESDINRQMLRLEAEFLRVRFDHYRRGFDRVQLSWKWITPLAGFLVARRMNKTGGFLSKTSALMMLLRGLWEAWQTRKAEKAAKGEEDRGTDGRAPLTS
jgi:hypothetical protein